MDGSELLTIADDWIAWRPDTSSMVDRRVELPDALSESVALVIQGVRRCGKSTLLHQLIHHYGLNPAHCVLINFEDPRLASDLRYEVLDTLVAAFRARHPTAQRLYFMLDEVQHVAGWERWLRSQLDRPAGRVFIVTGSNASMLAGELGSSLTGRHLTVELFPFDLAESRMIQPGLTASTTR